MNNNNKTLPYNDKNIEKEIKECLEKYKNSNEKNEIINFFEYLKKEK